MTLSREEILSSDDIRFTEVSVPEWGGEVRIGTMSGDERDAWEVFLMAGRDEAGNQRGEHIRATLVALSVVDNNDELLFTPDDVTALGRKSAVALDRLFARAKQWNRLSNQDIEELEKNSDGDPSDDSGT